MIKEFDSRVWVLTLRFKRRGILPPFRSFFLSFLTVFPKSPVSAKEEKVTAYVPDGKVYVTHPVSDLPGLLSDLQDFVTDCACYMFSRFPELTQLTEIDELPAQDIIRLHYTIIGKTFKPPKNGSAPAKIASVKGSRSLQGITSGFLLCFLPSLSSCLSVVSYLLYQAQLFLTFAGYCITYALTVINLAGYFFLG